MDNEYITQEDIMKMFKVSRPTVWRWAQLKQNKIPNIKINSTIRYNKQDVLDWFESHKTNGDRRTKGVGDV